MTNKYCKQRARNSERIIRTFWKSKILKNKKAMTVELITRFNIDTEKSEILNIETLI